VIDADQSVNAAVCCNDTMNTATQLLSEIRDRLQSAHFAARGLPLQSRAEAHDPVADQLHAIRVLAEELDGLLSHEVRAARA
jgi:hypothetical protein